MKCPKCDYLGFETGDRCKNCGYDFSLVSVADAEPTSTGVADYDIYPAAIDDVPVHVVDEEVDDAGGDTLRITLTSESPLQADERVGVDRDFTRIAITPDLNAGDHMIRTDAASTAAYDPALPLFKPEGPEDDEPLIKLPPAPRPPLAVRRTPDTPRLRAVPRPMSRPSAAPVLQFVEEIDKPEPVEKETPREVASETRVAPGVITDEPSRPSARVVAVLIDYVILLGIDAAVLYFTLRMAGLAMGEWRLLPLAPMVAFLALLKIAYFCAFTAVGGQTMGKMAVGTCVVDSDGRPLSAAAAMRRTAAGALSLLLLGVGFVPALFGDHRALHDRLAGTRVVRLRSV